jgi:hypothetical protein
MVVQSSMTVRLTSLLVVCVALLAIVGGCGDDSEVVGSEAPSAGPDTFVPERPPDVTGTVAVMGGAHGEGPHLTDPSDRYYEGMSLVQADTTIVSAATGQAVGAAEIQDGDAVEVWVTGGCGESFPVQCDVEALRITSPAG